MKSTNIDKNVSNEAHEAIEALDNAQNKCYAVLQKLPRWGESCECNDSTWMNVEVNTLCFQCGGDVQL